MTLAMMDEPLDIVWSRPLPDGAEPSTVTVSRDAAGRWFVSLLVEDPSVQPLGPAANAAVALDVGLTSLVTLSTGEKIANPRHERRDRGRLARAQRQLARKEAGSRNREKARRRVAKIHACITDRRRDHLHKLTTRLVRENQTIVVEELNVRGMLKNRSSVHGTDGSWSLWTSGTRRARRARRAGTTLRSSPSTSESGRAPRVAPCMTGTRTGRRTFWPSGRRS